MSEKILELPLKEVWSDDKFNSRGEIIPFSVIELSKSITELGLLQPIIVQPYDKCPNPGQKYRIVMGHRRYAASKMAKKDTIQAIVREGLTEREAFTLNVIENINREQLNILQEAKAIERYKMWGLSQAETSTLLNKSKGWVQTRYVLLELPPEIQAEAGAGLLSTDNIKQLGSMPRADQYAAVRSIKDAKLRGEKLKLRVPTARKINPYDRKIRNSSQITEMLNTIYDGIGPNLATRALAWAAGNISDVEFLKEVKRYALSINKDWIISNHIISEHFRNEERVYAAKLANNGVTPE